METDMQVNSDPQGAPKGEIEDKAEAKPKYTVRGMVILGVGGILGVCLANLSMALTSGYLIPLFGVLITFFGTVAAIGVSNDYPSTQGRRKADKKPPKAKKKPKLKNEPMRNRPLLVEKLCAAWAKDKTEKYSLLTRQLCAGFTFLGLGWTLVTSWPASPAPIDPLACYIDNGTDFSHAVKLKCGGIESLEITVNEANPQVEMRVSFANDDWMLTSATVETSKNGKTFVLLNTASDDQVCSYSRNTSAPAGATTKECRTKGTPSF